MSTFRVLLAALALDNFGSGLFLPLTMIWLTHHVGLSLPAAGVVLAAGTVVGTLAPAMAARVVDRLGARTLVAGSQLLQAAGMGAYLAARGPLTALVGALLTAVGVQLFYSSLNTMTTDVVAPSAVDDAFARVGRARGVAFGAGGLVGGLMLSSGDPRALTSGVVVNLLTFMVAAVLLMARVPAVTHSPGGPVPDDGPARVLHDRRYLVLLGTTLAFMLTVELFLLATPVYAHDHLGVPGWAVGAQITALTVIGILASTWVVRRTAQLRRSTCLQVGGLCFLAWSFVMASLAVVPGGARTWVLLAGVPVFCAGNLLLGPRLPALVGAIAPSGRKGAYFAYFQYAFTGAQLLAPLVTALISWRLTAVWFVNAAVVLTGLGGVLWLRRYLPAAAETQAT